MPDDSFHLAKPNPAEDAAKFAALLPVMMHPVSGGIRTIDAQRLHAFLAVETPFHKWILRRIEEFGFCERRDFWTNLSESSGGRPAKEYALTLVAALQIGAGENNAKGRQVLAYLSALIEQRAAAPVVDLNDPRQLRAILGNYAERNIVLEEKVAALETTAHENEPKIQTYEDLIGSKGGMLVEEVAKELCPVTGEIRLYRWMREPKVHIIIPGTRRPYQEHIDALRFYLKPHSYNGSGGEKKINHTLIVTPKGLAYIQQRWREYHEAIASRGNAA